jgi:hypothetical protein
MPYTCKQSTTTRIEFSFNMILLSLPIGHTADDLQE